MRFLLLLSFISLSAFATSADRKFNIKQYISGNATTVSTKILDGFTDRCYLSIVNSGVDSIYVKVGSAHSGTEGMRIHANGYWEPSIIPVGSLFVKVGTSTSAFQLTEGSCI